MKKFNVGPCLVCGGRVLKNGKRRHHVETHAKHKAQRKIAVACGRNAGGAKQLPWPRLLGCGKFKVAAHPTTASVEWLCKVLRSGEVVHYPAGASV